MPIYISMLRGINVAGNKTIKMSRLKAMFESAGFVDVETYIQSGNVVFRADEEDAALFETQIQRSIEKTFGFRVPVIVLRAAEMRRVVASCPFMGVQNVDETRLHVTFLSARPAGTLVKKMEPFTAKSTDGYKVVGSRIYLHCPDGYGTTLLSNTFFEKHLKVEATTRNWRTVGVLCALANK